MAFETPKTDWKPESVPEPKDFNRIESNIKTLEYTKEPKIDILPVDKGGTGANSFQEDCFIIGNNGNAFKTLSKAEASVGHAQRATCDENGNNIASTYLGTSKTLLTDKDAPISYMTELSLKDSIDKYKYLIFLIRGGATPESNFYYSTMIERSLFVELSNANYPFVIDGKTIRLMFSYLSSKQKILTIYTSTLGYLTVYGLN